MARLLDELVEAALLEIENASQWPPDATYYFDREAESDPVARVGPAQELLRRVVVSLRFARFQALQVVRQRRQGRQTVRHHSPQLQALVPKGQRDDDELLAPVGQHTLLEGHPLPRVQQELADRRPRLDLPLSRLYDLPRKFLFYFGLLHEQAAAAHDERAYRLFERLRRALRLPAQGDRPMRHAHQLLAAQAQEVREALSDLRQE